MFDFYQKRDKMSQYKKMHINTQLADSMFPNCESDKNMADADSPVSYYKNLKLGKAGLPIPPGGGSKGLLTQRNGQVPSLNYTN